MPNPTPSSSRWLVFIPGLTVSFSIAALAWLLVAGMIRIPMLSGVPASPMVVAILAGLALGGVAAARPGWQPGLSVARGVLLKLAVALIGLRLSLSELTQLGGQALPLVVIVIVVGLSAAYLAVRLAGGSRRLAGLLGVGTAICGASAIAALAPALKAKPEETAYAVACVAVIGLIATLSYPLLLQPLLGDPVAIGLVMGSAIHDTAQVTAAAAAHEQLWQVDGTINAATVTKLMRNFAMVLIIPMMAWLLSEDGARQRTPVPLFILAFIALSIVRSLGDAVLGPNHGGWEALIAGLGQLSQFLFAMAMAAIAMGIRPAQLRLLGWKPALAALSAAIVVLVSAITWVRWA